MSYQVLVRSTQDIRVLRRSKSCVGVSKSYIGINKSYVGDSESNVGAN